MTWDDTNWGAVDPTNNPAYQQPRPQDPLLRNQPQQAPSQPQAAPDQPQGIEVTELLITVYKAAAEGTLKLSREDLSNLDSIVQHGYSIPEQHMPWLLALADKGTS